MSHWTRRSAYHPDASQWRVFGLSLGVTILFVLYILYWNRLLANLVCLCLRLLTWDKTAPGSFWISAESIHISLISGRLILRDVRYYSANQTIRAVKCIVTWRYWLWRTRDKNDIEPDGPEEGTESKSSTNVPCRILLQFEGVEWLMYNRTMVFDDILAQAQNLAQADANHKATQNGTSFVPRSVWENSPETQLRAQSTVDLNENNDTVGSLNEERYPPPGFRIGLPRIDLPSKVWKWVMTRLPKFDFNDLLPIALEAKHGGIILGNPSMPSIFTITFKTGVGTYSVRPSRSKYDQYKQLYKLDFSTVAITANTNHDHRASMVENGKRLAEQFGQSRPQSKLGYTFSAFAASIRWFSFDPFRQEYKDDVSSATPWTGLRAFMTEAERDQLRQAEAEANKKRAEKRRFEVGPEYARDGNLLETPRLEVAYYADVAGLVPSNALSMDGTEELVDVGNGDVAPQWGVDLIMHGGSIVYGPWADRQRVHLQRALAPPAYSVIQPTKKRESGDTRLCTEFRLFVEFANEVTLRIPCREASKNWQFDKLPESAQTRRQAAQLSCKVGRNSTVNYVMPMVASSTGYHTSLKAQLHRVAIDSSLNNKVFLKAEDCRIRCDLPTPLIWNEARKWDFNITLYRPEVYLLRDHITLLTDLGKDWSSGPPTEIPHFIPMLYAVRIVLKDYSLAFNVNDQNIVDSLTDADANALFTLRGSSLNCVVDMPFLQYRPEATTILFSIESSDKLGLSLTFPKWNTRAAHSTSQITELGQANSVRVDGSYRYHSDVKPYFVDRLKLDIYGRTVSFKCFGWVIRHFMVLQANYFGSFTNFTLPAEAISKRPGDPVDAKYRAGHSNMMEVSLELQVTDATMALPQALLGYERSEDTESKGKFGLGSCALVAVPELSMSFRLHDSAMEMTLNVHPIGISLEATCTDAMLWNAARDRRKRKEILNISGLDVIANRLFGPQPHTATYVCIWEILVGHVRGNMAPQDVQRISSIVTSFGLNFKDELNAPAKEFQLSDYPDITFLKLKVASVNVNIETKEAFIILALQQGIQLSLNDMPTNDYSGVICTRVPEGHVQCLLRSSKSVQTWLESAAFDFDVAVDIYPRRPGWREAGERRKQFVQEQDRLTQRVPFIYQGSKSIDQRGSNYGALFLPHPALMRSAPITQNIPKIERQASFESGGTQEFMDANEQLRLSRPASTRTLRDQPAESSATDESDEPYSGSESPSTSGQDDSEDEWDDDQRWPEIHHYANVVRQFKRTRDTAVGGVSNSRFEMIKDVRSPTLFSKNEKSKHQRSRSKETAFHDPKFGSTDATIMRVLCSRGLDIVVSPILVHAIESILSTFYQSSPSFELELDELTSDLLKRKKNSESDKYSLSIELSMPSVHFRSVQSIMSSQDAGSLREPFVDPVPSNTLPVHSRIVSVLDIQVLNPSSTGLLGSTDHPLTIGARQMTLALATYDSHLLSSMHRKSNPVANPMLDLTIADSHVTLGNTRQPKLGNVQVTIQADAPAPILATIFLASRISKQVNHTLDNWVRSNKAKSQRLVWTILTMVDRGTSDPLSRAITSYLVQSGRPRELRDDVSWKILNHTRRTVSLLNSETRESISGSLDEAAHDLPSLARPDLVNAFREIWKDWILDLSEDDIATLPLFEFFSPIKTSSSIPTNMHPISIKTGFFQFTLQDPAEMGSEIRIGPFNIDIMERHPTLTILHGGISTASLGRAGAPVGPPQSFQNIGVVCDLGAFHVNLAPSLLPFAGRAYRAHKHLSPAPNSPTSPQFSQARTPLPPNRLSSTLSVDLSLHFQDLTVVSHAYNFGFELSLLHPTVALHSRLGSLAPRPFLQLAADTAGTLSCAWERLGLKVTETLESHARTTLAEFVIETLHSNASWYSRTKEKSMIRTSLTLERIYFSVPRHISRLVHSVERWWDGYFLNQVNPLINLMSTPSSPRPSRKVAFQPQIALSVDIQARISLIEIRLHVVLGVWLVWQMKNFGFVCNGGKTISPNHIQGGAVARLESQTVALETWKDPDDPRSILHDYSFDFPFPPFQISTRLEDKSIKCRGTFSLFEIVLNANAIDALVRASKQLASSDLERIFTLFQRSRTSELDLTPRSPVLSHSSFVSMDLQAQFLLTGFRLVLEGGSSLCFFDVKDVFGEGSGPKTWSFKVNDVSFSLAPKTVASAKNFDRRYRLAYMVFDLDMVSSVDQRSGFHLLNLRVDKIHAVLQATALSVLGDLVDSYQAEVMRGREELMRQRSLRRQRKSSVGKRPEPRKKKPSDGAWLDKRIINVAINSFGAAIPLIFEDAGAFLPSDSRPESIAVPAFLFSIQSIQFKTQSGEAGDVSLSRFAFQFIQSFDQSIPSHFLSENHVSQNQMIYPYMQAEVRSRLTSTLTEWLINAQVSGFELDIDPSIATFIFSLLDVYRLGFSKLEYLAEAVQAEYAATSTKKEPRKPAPAASLSSRTTHILTSLEFQSGRVRLHHEHKQGMRSRSTPSLSTSRMSTTSEISADILLPMVSLWVEWRATPASLKRGSMSDEAPSSLAFKSTIHSSKNVISPTVLKFVSQLILKVENRLSRPRPTINRPVQPSSPDDSEEDGYTRGALQSIFITFSLRIDQSTLEFTCQPDVNVRGALHWESGGFVATASPGARSVAFIGSVENLTANLKHGYLSEDCVEASIRNLAFSASISTSRNASGIGSSRTSLVIETDLTATALFARLQDILCFKAVWLDAITPFTGQATTPISPVSSKEATTPSRRSHERQWTSALLVKVRKLEAHADLGSAISVMRLALEPVTFRTLFTNETSEIFLTVGSLALDGVGLFTVNLSVPDFLFRTVRGRLGNFDYRNGKESLLNIELQSGHLEATIGFQGKPVLLYSSQPLQIVMLDDWRHCRNPQEDHSLLLHFTLLATSVNLVAVTTAPSVFVDLSQRIQSLLQAQYEGAAKESEAYRLSTTPKRHLADVASNVISTGEQDRIFSLGWATIQNMDVKLSRLCIGIARETLYDSQPWGRFEATDFEARLIRHVRGGQDGRRSEMFLGLGSLQLHRLISQASEVNVTATQWLERSRLERKEVMTVPSIRFDMKTREFTENGIPVIAFDLHNEQDTQSGNRLFSIGTDLVLFDWVRDMYHLTVQHVLDMRSRHDTKSPQTPQRTEGPTEELLQSFSLEPTAKQATTATGSGPFMRGGKQWRPESVKLRSPVIQQLGNFSPGVGFYNLVVRGNLDQAVAVWIHELVTIPVSELNGILLSLYTKQLQIDHPVVPL